MVVLRSEKQVSQWLKQSPAFLMDRIETPLRIQALNPDSLLSDWHWYTGLSRLGKPVEMIYIPDGYAHPGETLGADDVTTGRRGLVLFLA